MNVLLIAMDQEFKALETKYSLKKLEHKHVTAYIPNTTNNWIILRAGIGPIATSIALTQIAALHKIKNIIHFGVGGSVSDSVQVGDYVIANKVIQHDSVYISDEMKDLMGTAQLYLSRPDDLVKEIETSVKLTSILESFCRENEFNYITGPIASGSSFVAAPKIKKDIAKMTNAIMVEMEAAAAIYFSDMYNVNYGFIKICSDSHESNAIDEYADFVSSNVKTIPKLLELLDKELS